MDSPSQCGQSTTDVTDSSVNDASNLLGRRRVLKKRKPGSRTANLLPSGPLAWKDVLRRLQWGLLSWASLYALCWIVYDEADETLYGPFIYPYIRCGVH